MKSSEFTVADCLITRLKEIGVDHLFGVQGDFVLGFFNQVLKSDLKYVGTCNELNQTGRLLPYRGCTPKTAEFVYFLLNQCVSKLLC